MRIPLPIREIYKKVFHLLRDLTLQSSFFFLDADYASMSAPVAFNIFQCLLEEKW